MSQNVIQLPNGDLWRPPVIKEDGSAEPHVPRPDTVDINNLPARPNMTPDVAAILMNDLQRQAQSKAAS